MEFEKQVCSLELAKKLKDLGVKQESLFWYWEDADGISKGSRLEDHEPHNPKRGWNTYSAFTVAELGEMLPRTVGSYILICAFNPDSSECAISYFMASNSTHHPEIKSQYGDTEADTRAKMLIYLLENNLVTPKDI